MKKNKTILMIALVALAVSCKPSKYANLDKGLYADIETNKGAILVELYQQDVPLTVANFVSLAEGTNPNVSDSLKGRKFYDGLKFHRVIKDFMVQGGDPAGVGSGGPGYKFEDEFPKDSLGKLLHSHDTGGTLSMANSGPGTNGSQFFITHTQTSWLDGKHTVFGKVKYGQKIVDSIAKNDTIKHITFIKIGPAAQEFNAAKVFVEMLKKSEISKKDRVNTSADQDKVRYEKFLADQKVYEASQGIAKATKMPSGLQILTLKEGKGKKVSENESISVHYTLTLADGKPVQTTVGKDPFVFSLDKQPMIAGFTEGILTMRNGGKARLFIPYNLAWGEEGSGPFPAKAAVVFELEVLKVGE